MKILIILYDFYPENKPNAYRWFNVAKKWQKEGHEIFVITANKNQYLPFETVEGIKIYRSTEYFVGNLKYKYRENVNDQSQFETKNKNSNYNGILKRIVRKIYEFTWTKLYWPDYSFLWYFSSVPLASKIIEEQKIDKLVTVSWTFTAHLIGLKLKRKYNYLYWLADTIDIFSFNGKINNISLYHKLNRLTEKRIFSKADFNTVLTDKIKHQYIKIFPEISNKIIVNHNVFVPNNFDYEKTFNLNEKIVRILFLGTLSEEARSPKRMLFIIDQLLNQFTNIKFVFDFYGEFSDSIELFYKYPHLIDKSIFLHGFVNREKVNDLIKNADVLLNVGNKNEYQEPSKLIEYIYSGKKILNFCSMIFDTSLELLENYPLKFNVLSNDQIDRIFVDKIYNFLINSDSVDKKIIDVLLKNYLLDEISNKYMSVLNRNKNGQALN